MALLSLVPVTLPGLAVACHPIAWSLCYITALPFVIPTGPIFHYKRLGLGFCLWLGLELLNRIPETFPGPPVVIVQFEQCDVRDCGVDFNGDIVKLQVCR